MSDSVRELGSVSEVLGVDELLYQEELYFDTFDMGGTPSGTHQKIIGELYRQLAKFFEGKECEPILSPFKIDLVEQVKSLDEFTKKVLVYKFRQYNSKYRNESDTVILNKFKFVPDLSVICNWEKFDNEGGVLFDTPTLVIEVTSPSTQKSDYDFKKLVYEKCGVEEYIIFDDILRASHYWKNDNEYQSCNVHAVTNPDFSTALVLKSKSFGLELTLNSGMFRKF